MNACPDCGAAHEAPLACDDDFHTLLGWENEFPGYGVVHNLLVLCYHLQHPRLYSPEGLNYAKGLLLDFLEKGKTTEDVRRENKRQVSSSHRTWKVTARPGAQGSYSNPVTWTMTALDIVRAGPEGYIKNVRAWAEAVLTSLRAAGEV